MSTTIYFLRHGQSEANVLHVYAKPDTRLSDFGREQAANVAHTPDLPRFDRIYSSDYARAWETAEIAVQAMGYSVDTIIKEPRLREINVGLLAGQGDGDLKSYYDAANTPGNPMKVELPAAVDARLNSLVVSLSGVGDNVLLVGHSGSGMLLRHLVNNSPISLNAEGQLVNGQIVKFGEIS